MSSPRPGAASRPLVICNPAAGRRLSGGTFSRMIDALRGAAGELDVSMTTHPGHGVELAAAAALEGRPLVVSFGGDGTLNEVVNGLLRGRAPAEDLPRLGVVAAGTGGDFGRSLGIGKRFEDYVAALARGSERPLDAGVARFRGADGSPAERYWLNVLSAGIGGLVDRYAADAPGFVGGRLAYAQATVRAIVMCRRVRLCCRAVLPDGTTAERRLHAHAVVVANGGTFGGGMRIAPMARPDDGLLEVLTFETETRTRLVRRLGTVYRGTHLDEPGVAHFSCRSLTLEPEDAANQAAAAITEDSPGAARRRLFPLDIDGEALGDVPLAVEVLPRALLVRA
jgi:diacylglycerol kinase (ATP)